MLSTEPVTRSVMNMSLWKRMKPISLQMLGKYWQMVDPERPLIDTDNAEYKEWEESYYRVAGMVRKSNGKLHGIVRSVHRSNGAISEIMWKDERWHGLQRRIHNRKVQVRLYRDGTFMAEFNFDYNFQEISRRDRGSYLADLTAETFRI